MVSTGQAAIGVRSPAFAPARESLGTNESVDEQIDRHTDLPDPARLSVTSKLKKKVASSSSVMRISKLIKR